MRLTEGGNYLISERDGLVICQLWTRPDQSQDEGAKNAEEMVSFLSTSVLGAPCRGIIFDMRRGPRTFGPKTRSTMATLFARAVRSKVQIAIITSDAATQVLQFRGLCAGSPTVTQIFDNESAAVRWLRTQEPSKS